MEVNKIKNIAFWIMIVVIIILSIYVILFFKTRGAECMNNPAVYFIEGANKANDGNTICTCTLIPNSDKPYVGFILDKDGIHSSNGN